MREVPQQFQAKYAQKLSSISLSNILFNHNEIGDVYYTLESTKSQVVQEWRLSFVYEQELDVQSAAHCSLSVKNDQT